MRSNALAHQGVALITRRGEQVGGELEDRPIVFLQPAQDVHEGLLRRVRRVVRRARQPQAVVVDLGGVAVVERAVRDPTARSSFLDEYAVWGGGPAVEDRNSGHESPRSTLRPIRTAVNAGFEHGAERLDDSRVELRARIPAQLLQRSVQGGRLAVGARVGHRVERVAYRDHP